jgi:hypothetical protein
MTKKNGDDGRQRVRSDEAIFWTTTKMPKTMEA